MTGNVDMNRVMVTKVTPDSQLEVYFEKRAIPEPRDHEVLVKIQAAPINPSDLGLLFGAADMTSLQASERDGLPALIANVSAPGMRAMAGRIDAALPIGNEGCGIVVKAGTSPEAQALLGKMVTMFGGEMYADYRCLAAGMCMLLPEGTDPEDGASCFVNPLTALSFTETMKMDGYSGLVHAAAASNLGQMLVKICKADGIPLVNIVRSPGQAEILKAVGATHILDSTSDGFMAELTEAIVETGAFMGFDPIGGGKMASQMLTCMEAAAVKRMGQYSRYGSDTAKQVYIYGALDAGPTILNRSFGFVWGLNGWLLTPFMSKAGPEIVGRMRKRVIDELTTTFKSHYSHRISLTEALDPAIVQAYNAKRTGEKYLIKA